ncbi:hypothetical protein Syun_019594 [Stephania yunnanensis]|uniref:Calcineurin B-like protein n=1 Tax=Stephania yunnanensis TaxID=152371 RepID=A0AAP0IUC6_9MAGN
MKTPILQFKHSVSFSLYAFNAKEVESLHELFKKLSNSITDDGLISKISSPLLSMQEEFQLGLLGSSKMHSLIADRIFTLFDFKRDGKIEFEEFITSLNIFHPNASKEDKAAFMFQFYDTRQNGFIEREEVKEMVMAMLSESDLILSNDIVDRIIDKTFEEVDSRKDGKIDQEEWKQFAIQSPNLLRKMTIPYLMDISTAFPSFTLRSEFKDETLDVRKAFNQT